MGNSQNTYSNHVPGSKATAGTTAAAITVIIVWVAGMFGLEIPEVVAAAFTALITGAVVYFVPERNPHAYKGPRAVYAIQEEDN